MMRKYFYFCSLFIVVTFTTYAQYPIAPEVWSIPKKVAIISETLSRAESPSISWDGQSLYFDWIGATEWADTGWGVPYRLNNNINQNLATYPSISPDGKRLFFTWFVGGWDLYYSDWDSTINDWGEAVTCGPNVNTGAYAEGGCVLPNDTTLIYLKTSDANISYWNSETETWGPSERWPTPYLWFTSDYGIYVSPDFKKVYDTGARLDTTITGESYLNYYIEVSYRDTTNPMGYKPPNILNFCLYSDTQYFAGNYSGRFEGFPTLTPDGKKMYFTADYDSQITIYESIMLIDENGNPVNVERENEKLLPDKTELLAAYPNPFNPTTSIQYVLNSMQFVTLKVYDLLGNEVATLVNEEKTAGSYIIKFDGSNLPSGVYFYQLRVNNFVDTKKMVLLK